MPNSINKVIEQVAYKQVEDMIVYLEMLDEQFLKTSKTARENAKLFGIPSVNNSDLNKKLLESQKIIKQLQDDYKKNQDALDKLTKKVDEHTKAKAKMTQEGRNAIIDAREERKILDGNAVANSNLTTYIQKLSVERAKASRVVADYNAQIAMGNKLTEEQSQELTQATAQFQKYDNAIKAGKTSIGDAREYVGQYERANVGLSNSIGQIARELPSATFGFQTFALGISNNIPIAVDEIKKAIDANNVLIKQGKPVESVWKQIGSALFSFNTLMSVGLLLLALYGKEIGNFFSNLVNGTKSLNEATKALDNFQKAQSKGTENTKNELQIYKEYLNIAENKSLGYDRQKIAIDKLRASTGSLLKAYSDEDIMNGKLSGSTTDLNIQKIKGYGEQYKANLSEIQSINAKIEAYKLEIQNRKKYNDELERLNEIRYDTSRDGLEILSTVKLIKSLKEREKIRKENIKDEIIQNSTSTQLFQGLSELQAVYDLSLGKSQVLKNKSIILDEQDTKAKDENTKSIKLNTKAREDYLASEYELWKLRKTNQANTNKDIMDDEAMGYELRFEASQQYHSNMIELAQREAMEEQRILKYNLDEKNRTLETERLNEINQLDTQLKNKQIQQEDYNAKLKDIDENYYYDKNGIQKKYENESLMISENYIQKYLDINIEAIGKMRKAWEEINFGKAQNEIDNIDLKNIENIVLELQKVGGSMNTGEIEKAINKINILNARMTADIALRNATLKQDEAQANVDRIIDDTLTKATLLNLSQDQTADLLANNKALIDAENNLIEAKKAVGNASKQVTEGIIEDNKKVKKDAEDRYQFELEQAKNLSNELSGLTNQLFQNNVDRYDRDIEKSNEYYDSLLANAEKGSEQEKLIQEEKARHEEEIQRRKIDLQRKQAIFNKMMALAEITINLMLELSKNAATVGSIPAAVLNAYAIASAAVKTATVLAQPLPQYKDGTDYHKGGKALLGDGYVTEVVENPDGSIFLTPNKPTILDLPKGAKVHSSLEDFNKNKLNLESASIMASFTNQSNQLKAFDYYIGKELKGLPEKIEKGIEKGFKNAKINNTIQNNINLGKKPSNFFN